jgi:hypothetical protein
MKLATHVEYMVYAAAAIFIAFTVVGVPLTAALSYGVVLACPVVMIGMMFMMGGHGHGGEHEDEHDREGTSRRTRGPDRP